MGKLITLLLLFGMCFSCVDNSQDRKDPKFNGKKYTDFQWGIPVFLNDVPGDVCPYLKAVSLKSKYGLKVSDACKTISLQNKRMLSLSSRSGGGDELITTIFFSQADGLNFNAEIEKEKANTAFGGAFKLESFPAVKCFSVEKGIKIYVNELLQFWVAIEGDSVQGAAGGMYNAMLKDIAEVILSDLKKKN